MPRQFLLESISVDPSDVNDELFSTIRTQTGVLSVGILPKSSSAKLNSSASNDKNKQRIKVALLSVEDAAADSEGVIDKINEAAKKVGLAIYVPSAEDKKKQQEQAAKKQQQQQKKTKVPLTQTAFTAKPTASDAPKPAPKRGNGKTAAPVAAASTTRGGRGGNNNNNNRSSSNTRGRGGRGGNNNNRSTSQRGGRGRGGRGGRGNGRGNGRGGKNRVPTHMQAMMSLQPPNELLNRAAGQQQAAMLMNMMNNLMMQQQTAFFNNPYYNHSNHLNGGGRLWTADVHAIFCANVAPPVTNKQLSLAAGEDIVMVHIERGEDVAIMYVATEQQARSAVMKLNGSYLYDRTLNVSYGGRKQIPLPYPPNHLQQQQQPAASPTSSSAEKKEEKKEEKHVDPAAGTSSTKTESK